MFFFAKQTSWIPSLELTNKVRQFEKEQKFLRRNNEILRDSIVNLTDFKVDTTLANNTSIIKPDKLSDSSFYYARQYRSCVVSNKILMNKMDSLNNELKTILYDCKIWQGQYAYYNKRDSILIKRIEDKNILINNWNQRMEAGDMKLQRADIERILAGHMGDESYYKKLFKPIAIEKRSNVIKGY